MMDSWHTYPSIYALGHRAIESLLPGNVIVEEKVDGSQFSFGVDLQGEVHVRSKGADINVEFPEKMFGRAIDSVLVLREKLTPGYTYRAEYLQKPKHNTLVYGRVPVGYLIVFDINDGHESYLVRSAKEHECRRIGLECVPLLSTGYIGTPLLFCDLLDRESCLGGTKIEGVVVKPLGYDKFGLDKKVLMGKFVSEAFKEKHARAWKVANPGPTDALDVIAESLRTEARWAKSLQHLRECGQIEQSPRDIGSLLKEVTVDVEKECRAEIEEALWKWAWPSIRRKITHGLPEWYKNRLLETQFDEPITEPK